jgi:acyl dehydratase
MDGDGQLYLDDFELGDRFRSPGHTLGEAHFLLFSGLTRDNHPIHYDEDYARQTRFGARVAHGLLVMAMSALGASPLAQRLETSMIALLEQGGRFRKPVLLVDTVPTPLMRRRALPRDLLSANRRMTESRESNGIHSREGVDAGKPLHRREHERPPKVVAPSLGPVKVT